MSEEKITTEQAMKKLTSALIADKDYYYSWQANIAMAFKDEWQRASDSGGLPCTPEHIHNIANDAAKYFLDLLCKSPSQEEGK